MGVTGKVTEGCSSAGIAGRAATRFAFASNSRLAFAACAGECTLGTSSLDSSRVRGGMSVYSGTKGGMSMYSGSKIGADMEGSSFAAEGKVVD